MADCVHCGEKIDHLASTRTWWGQHSPGAFLGSTAHESCCRRQESDLLSEIVDAAGPLIARSSSDETITLELRTADIQRLRTLVAKAEGVVE